MAFHILVCLLSLPTAAIIVHACSNSFCSSSAAHSVDAACHSLIASLGSTKVQTANPAGLNPDYELSAKGAWNLFNQLDQPTCIVFPTSTEDVVVAMKAIYAADSHYAVRGGGHSAMPGWNTIQNGVLIDFSHMKSYSYNSSSDTITMQPGVLWGEVCDGLEKQGVAPVGGRESDIGVSGLLLGGGLSYLSPSSGFACDTYRSLDVVLPSGELITVTGTNAYSDLFRALKGGGSRFGIVTRYEVQAIHVGTAADKTWYGGLILYPNSSSSAVVDAIDNFIYSNTDSNAVALVTISQLNTGGSISTVSGTTLFYNGSQAAFNATFSEFLSIPTDSVTLGSMSYNDITKVLPPGNERTNGQLYGGSALYPHRGHFQRAFTHWTNFTNTFINELFLSTIAWTPVPQSQIDISNMNGGTAFAPPDGAYAAIQLSQTFPSGVTTISPAMAEGLKFLFEQIPRSAGLPLYLNESNEVQDALRTYRWYEQLKRVYAKYDPIRFNVRRLFGPNGL